MLLDLGPGDTVIVPSFTFTTTALAYARQGAGLVFCDVERRTLGLDPEHLATLLDETVRAVVVVHYAGIACDIEGIRAVLAPWPDIALIEDNAHGLFGSWHGQPLGHPGALRRPELPRDQELRLWRGRCAGAQRGTGHRPGAGALRQGHQPARVHARAGREVHLEGHRLLLRSRRRPGGLPAGPARATRPDPGQAPCVARALHQQPGAAGGRAGVRARGPTGRTGSRRTTCSTCCCRTGTAATTCSRPCARRASAPPSTTCRCTPRTPGGCSRPGRRSVPVSDDVSGRLLRLPFYNNLGERDLDRTVEAFLAAAHTTLRV